MKVLLFANTDWYLYNFRRSLIVALRDSGYEVLLVSPPGAYSKMLLDLGFRWIEAPMDRRSLNPLSEILLIKWLYKLICNEQVNIVHGFTIKCAVYASFAARLGGRTASVNSVAGMGYVFTSNHLKARLLRPVVSILLRAALNGINSRLILQNPDDVDLFIKSGLIERERVRLIMGSGVNCRNFAPLLNTVVAKDNQRRLKVLLAARLLWDKGLGEYVEAARKLHAEGRDIEFFLAGLPDIGNPAAVPEGTVLEWVREGVLQWLGHVEDMPDLFRSVDVVVLPSYREGLPKSLIEAAACGVALVTTDVPGCRAVVKNEVDGLLVPVKDAAALANAISRLHDDEKLRARLGQAARHKAISDFDDQIVINRTISVYNELLMSR